MEKDDKEVISQRVVDAVESAPIANSKAWAKQQGVTHDALVGCVKSLWANQVLTLDQSEQVRHAAVSRRPRPPPRPVPPVPQCLSPFVSRGAHVPVV